CARTVAAASRGRRPRTLRPWAGPAGRSSAPGSRTPRRVWPRPWPRPPPPPPGPKRPESAPRRSPLPWRDSGAKREETHPSPRARGLEDVPGQIRVLGQLADAVADVVAVDHQRLAGAVAGGE